MLLPLRLFSKEDQSAADDDSDTGGGGVDISSPADDGAVDDNGGGGDGGDIFSSEDDSAGDDGDGTASHNVPDVWKFRVPLLLLLLLLLLASWRSRSSIRWRQFFTVRHFDLRVRSHFSKPISATALPTKKGTLGLCSNIEENEEEEEEEEREEGHEEDEEHDDVSASCSFSHVSSASLIRRQRRLVGNSSFCAAFSDTEEGSGMVGEAIVFSPLVSDDVEIWYGRKTWTVVKFLKR